MNEEPSRDETKSIILRDVLPVFLITRAIIALVGRISSYVIVKGKFYGKPKAFLDLFYRWDARWFMTIIDEGYFNVPGRKSNVVFFPLYPLLVKAVTALTRDPKTAGFLVSNVALFIALVYLVKLIQVDYNDRDLAVRSAVYFLVFPASLFFSVFYSEGLFLCLAISCFYYARRKKWLVASILGFFLSLTRSIGVFIFIPLVMEYFDLDFSSFRINLKRIKPDILWLLLVPAGLLTYMAFLYIKFSDAFLFSSAHGLWGRRVATIWATLLSYKKFPYFYQLVFLGTLVLILLVLFYSVASKIRMSYTVFVLVNVVVFLSSALLESFPRYMAVLFPMYIALALAARKSRVFDSLWTYFSFALLVLFTVLFVNGYWLT